MFNDKVIHKLNWDEICQLSLNDSNVPCKNFIDTISYHLDEYAPYRQLTNKECELLGKPWNSNAILENAIKEIPYSKISLRKRIKLDYPDLGMNSKHSGMKLPVRNVEIRNIVMKPSLNLING